MRPPRRPIRLRDLTNRDKMSDLRVTPVLVPDPSPPMAGVVRAWLRVRLASSALASASPRVAPTHAVGLLARVKHASSRDRPNKTAPPSQLYERVRPQSHDKSSTEQSCTCPSMMRRPRSQQPAMAPNSVEYVMGALKARKPLRRPIRRSRVQRPEPRI